MKSIVAVITLMTVLFLWNGAVHAHVDHAHSHAGVDFDHFDGLESAAEQGGHAEVERRADDHADFMMPTPHDPADHSHRPGEDSFHDKSSHFVSVDFAHYAQALPLALARFYSERSRVWHHRASGLSVRPPIRPPLG